MEKLFEVITNKAGDLVQYHLETERLATYLSVVDFIIFVAGVVATLSVLFYFIHKEV